MLFESKGSCCNAHLGLKTKNLNVSLHFSKRKAKMVLKWSELARLAQKAPKLDRVRGAANAQATLRLFGHAQESDVRVTLFRDKHAWCPYCQKVWLFLEEKEISYRIKKVTMFCYGEKERWYKKIVPSGMLPALQIDGKIITESDYILYELEEKFGPLALGMNHNAILPLRKLERSLFASWCHWLCYQNSEQQERMAQAHFEKVARIVDQSLASTPGAYFLETFTEADVIFCPYIERMAASLFYYKGYNLKQFKSIRRWFAAMEGRKRTYRGTQSDYHTHCHDLPPQMGGCYSNKSAEAARCAALVDGGIGGDEIPEASYEGTDAAPFEALARVLKHRQNIVAANPNRSGKFEDALQVALSFLVTGREESPPDDSAADLRYLRDRVNVPRDMSLHAARSLRRALELTARLDGDEQGPRIPLRHRRDQNPLHFCESKY